MNQKTLAIVKALGILRDAGIECGVSKMYGSTKTDVIISMKGVNIREVGGRESPSEKQKEAEKVL